MCGNSQEKSFTLLLNHTSEPLLVGHWLVSAISGNMVITNKINLKNLVLTQTEEQAQFAQENELTFKSSWKQPIAPNP